MSLMNKFVYLLLVILIITIFVISYKLGRRGLYISQLPDTEDDIINKQPSSTANSLVDLFYSPELSIIFAFLVGFTWSVPNITTLVDNPISSLFIGFINGIIAAFVTLCLLLIVPYSLIPIIPSLLFASIIFFIFVK